MSIETSIKKLSLKWKLTAGDDFQFEIEWDFDLDDYTLWRCQLRAGPYPHVKTKVNVPVTIPHPDDEPRTIRFDIAGADIVDTMDGWEGDAQVTIPSLKVVTFAAIKIKVASEYTENT